MIGQEHTGSRRKVLLISDVEKNCYSKRFTTTTHSLITAPTRLRQFDVESFRIAFFFLTSEMSITLRRDPVCSCPITDYRGLRLDANQLWLNFQKKTSVAAINITLGVPGRTVHVREERTGRTLREERTTFIP